MPLRNALLILVWSMFFRKYPMDAKVSTQASTLKSSQRCSGGSSHVSQMYPFHERVCLYVAWSTELFESVAALVVVATTTSSLYFSMSAEAILRRLAYCRFFAEDQLSVEHLGRGDSSVLIVLVPSLSIPFYTAKPDILLRTIVTAMMPSSVPWIARTSRNCVHCAQSWTARFLGKIEKKERLVSPQTSCRANRVIVAQIKAEGMEASLSVLGISFSRTIWHHRST